jgi:DNA-binding response OmpR family regulator
MQSMKTTKPRILYVDEDAEESFTLATCLRVADYDPVTANFASDALQFARNEEFDIYLLSRRFPVGPGTYLCQRLHEIAPQTPIIFLSEETPGQTVNISSGSPEHIANSRDAHAVLAAVRLVLDAKKSAPTNS